MYVCMWDCVIPRLQWAQTPGGCVVDPICCTQLISWWQQRQSESVSLSSCLFLYLSVGRYVGLSNWQFVSAMRWFMLSSSKFCYASISLTRVIALNVDIVHGISHKYFPHHCIRTTCNCILPTLEGKTTVTF